MSVCLRSVSGIDKSALCKKGILCTCSVTGFAVCCRLHCFCSCYYYCYFMYFALGSFQVI